MNLYISWFCSSCFYINPISMSNNPLISWVIPIVDRGSGLVCKSSRNRETINSKNIFSLKTLEIIEVFSLASDNILRIMQSTNLFKHGTSWTINFRASLVNHVRVNGLPGWFATGPRGGSVPSMVANRNRSENNSFRARIDAVSSSSIPEYWTILEHKKK